MKKILTFLSVIALSACQTFVAPPSTPNPLPETWELDAKIAYRGIDSGSVFVDWQFNHGIHAIDASGALGIGRTRIVGNHIELSVSNTDGQWSGDTQTVMAQLIGWHAPIEYLHWWLAGQPKETTTTSLRTETTVRFTEANWQVEASNFQAFHGKTLPTSIKIFNATDRLIIRISEWQF